MDISVHQTEVVKKLAGKKGGRGGRGGGRGRGRAKKWWILKVSLTFIYMRQTNLSLIYWYKIILSKANFLIYQALRAFVNSSLTLPLPDDLWVIFLRIVRIMVNLRVKWQKFKRCNCTFRQSCEVLVHISICNILSVPEFTANLYCIYLSINMRYRCCTDLP